MAKATKITEKKRIRKTVEVTTGINLELSLEEAIALRLLVGKIGGNPTGTIRIYTDSIYHTLIPIVEKLANEEYFENKRYISRCSVDDKDSNQAVEDIKQAILSYKPISSN